MGIARYLAFLQTSLPVSGKYGQTGKLEGVSVLSPQPKPGVITLRGKAIKQQ